jgi:hypothetical protein
MWMGFPVKLAVGKTTFSAHFSTPQTDIKRLLKNLHKTIKKTSTD